MWAFFFFFLNEVGKGSGSHHHDSSSDSHRRPSGYRAVTHVPLKQDVVSSGLLDTPGSGPGPLTLTLRFTMTPRV